MSIRTLTEATRQLRTEAQGAAAAVRGIPGAPSGGSAAGGASNAAVLGAIGELRRDLSTGTVEPPGEAQKTARRFLP